jgi:hypothetical protein
MAKRKDQQEPAQPPATEIPETREDQTAELGEMDNPFIDRPRPVSASAPGLVGVRTEKTRLFRVNHTAVGPAGNGSVVTEAVLGKDNIERLLELGAVTEVKADSPLVESVFREAGTPPPRTGEASRSED